MRLHRVLLAAALAGPVFGQVTSRVNVSTAGAEADDHDAWALSISVDGRYVAFASHATNIVAGDPNGQKDVFLRDRLAGTSEIVSVATNGAPGDGASGDFVSISADGRFVAFDSRATNLVAGDTNGVSDVFLRDRQSGTTELVSIGYLGFPANLDSRRASISADGRFVAFTSLAANLVAGDTNGVFDVFVRDRQLGTTERVSVTSNGTQANGEVYDRPVSITPDGRYVAFVSGANNLVPNDGNLRVDVFLRDRQSATTERISVNPGGGGGNGHSGAHNFGPPSQSFDLGISISADGRYVAFGSRASNLVAGDTNGKLYDVFLRDRQSGTTERVNLPMSGGQAAEGVGPSISDDGRYVAFASTGADYVPGDTNAKVDVFVRDRQSGTTERVSVASSGTEADGGSGFYVSTEGGGLPVNRLCFSMSPHGRHVAFVSFATNLVAGDTNGTSDVFVHDRALPLMASLCSPGTAGVIECPCSNSPSGPGRGCDNSSATGGAILSGSGAAELSQDTLVFTTSGEKPTALSILAQWLGPNSNGVIFGQGVRCTSGTFKRLFAKNAVGGSITVPDLGAGDPTVSARSAAKGDTILAAQSRWYVVYYRDNTVLGGCPASSTFNSTQTGRIDWSL